MFHVNEKLMGWLGGTGGGIGGLFLLDIPHLLFTAVSKVLIWALTIVLSTFLSLWATKQYNGRVQPWLERKRLQAPLVWAFVKHRLAAWWKGGRPL